MPLPLVGLGAKLLIGFAVKKLAKKAITSGVAKRASSGLLARGRQLLTGARPGERASVLRTAGRVGTGIAVAGAVSEVTGSEARQLAGQAIKSPKTLFQKGQQTTKTIRRFSGNETAEDREERRARTSSRIGKVAKIAGVGAVGAGGVVAGSRLFQNQPNVVNPSKVPTAVSGTPLTASGISNPVANQEPKRTARPGKRSGSKKTNKIINKVNVQVGNFIKNGYRKRKRKN